jgi:hypothetical protein
MPLQDFLPVVASSLSTGQRTTLQRFLQDVQAGRVAASPEAIAAALEVVGDLIPQPDVDLTDPVGFNQAVQTLQTNIAGLYQEVDRLESVMDGIADLNRSDLDRVEIAARDLSNILSATQQANAANLQWTDVFFETFGAEVNRETDRDWYKPLPQLATSGQIESYLPLFVDPDDRSLKLLPGGDFSRSTNAQGDPLAQVEVEELLGLSADPTHKIQQAVDGKFYTYWRELILSELPIQADPQQVHWLPEAYAGGTACRLHFRFPFAVPFTEIVVRPFARHPIQALQVVWDNRRQAKLNLLRDRNFTSGNTFWTSGMTSVGATFSYPSSNGFDNLSYANIEMTSGRATLRSNTFMVSGSQFAYHLVYKFYREEDITPQVLVEWFDLSSNLVRADWFEPTTPIREWTEVSKLFIAPSGVTSGYTGRVTLITDGSGTVSYTSATFSETAGALQLDQKTDLESDTLLLALDNAAGTDIWLVLAQPHYELLQMTVPEGELDQNAIWDDVRLQAEARAQSVLSTENTLWRLAAGDRDTEPDPLRESGSMLLKEAVRLGGRVRDMVLGLVRYSTPSTKARTLNRYLYIVGAWEIQIRHREYAPQGLFVSKPYHPRGEVRELALITDPPLSTLSDRVRFWLTARAGDRSDRAQSFSGRATFSSATEDVSKRADCHFTLTPVTIREGFDGTDRLNRVALTHHPYVDRDRVWTIQTQLTSGTVVLPLAYDPNKELVFQEASGSIRAVLGYRPIRVTLEFPDGRIARPDILGRVQLGDITFQGPEVLEEATVEQTRRFKTERGGSLFDAIAETDRQSKARRSADSTERESTQTVAQTALKTRFRKIVAGDNGVALSLYWHKSGDDSALSGTVTTGDVLINPVRYSVDAQNGVITVRDTAPNSDYDSFVAYYYYHQEETGARAAQDSRDSTSLPTSGVDFDGSLPQVTLVTRNVTDYVRGVVPSMRPVNTDDLDPDYYPVYEYLVDDRGRLVFASNHSRFGDTPARVIVEYESLEIEPRLIIEYARGAINEFTTKTPIINSYTLLMNSRR